MKLLLVEDSEQMSQFIKKGLTEAGHVVDHAGNGRDGLFLASSEPYDIIIMDRLLPGGIDGLGIITALRQSGNKTPILILSALAEVDEKIRGLQAGGDDYLTKPFSFGELAARLAALLRRARATGPETVLSIADLQIELLPRRVTRAGKPIELLGREYRLLEFLMRHAEEVVTRTMLLENVWDYHFDPQTNVIEVHISKIRQKIDEGFSKSLIKTIRGAGYMLTARD
jgi:two-component system, OmpR family, response regulator